MLQNVKESAWPVLRFHPKWSKLGTIVPICTVDPKTMKETKMF